MDYKVIPHPRSLPTLHHDVFPNLFLNPTNSYPYHLYPKKYVPCGLLQVLQHYLICPLHITINEDIRKDKCQFSFALQQGRWKISVLLITAASRTQVQIRPFRLNPSIRQIYVVLYDLLLTKRTSSVSMYAPLLQESYTILQNRLYGSTPNQDHPCYMWL